jgi:biopolymer transport protein ExbB
MPPETAASFWDQYPAAVQSVARFFFQGGFFMLLIVLCSLLALTVVLWKALVLRRRHIIPDDVADALAAGDAVAARSGDSTLGRLVRYAGSAPFLNRAEASEAVQARARSEVTRLESGLTALEVVITIAPLLGLLGTVKGLVVVFSTLGAGADLGADPAGIALGIAEALNTTIAGLSVAVPTVVAHSYFTRKIEKLALRMEVLVGDLLSRRFQAAPPASPPTPATAAPAPARAR